MVVGVCVKWRDTTMIFNGAVLVENSIWWFFFRTEKIERNNSFFRFIFWFDWLRFMTVFVFFLSFSFRLNRLPTFFLGKTVLTTKKKVQNEKSDENRIDDDENLNAMKIFSLSYRLLSNDFFRMLSVLTFFNIVSANKFFSERLYISVSAN